ncbi:hypothetical protein [Rhizobium etli]|nr:hypothetical protein [Rhizobium etli]
MRAICADSVSERRADATAPLAAMADAILPGEADPAPIAVVPKRED